MSRESLFAAHAAHCGIHFGSVGCTCGVLLGSPDPDAEGRAVDERTHDEQRLEDLRFFVIEGEANFKHHLSEWMQEVERQIEALRRPSRD